MPEPGPVYVRKHVRDKYDLIVDEVDLLHANQNHSVVRYPEGSEVTVSALDIAPTATTPSNGNSRDPSPLPVQVQPDLVGNKRATLNVRINVRDLKHVMTPKLKCRPR